jgi:NAD-dependent DNA ligase
MLSLDNALTEEELRDFDRRVRSLLGGDPYSYVTELKLDGLSMAARFENGIFVRGITRATGSWAKTLQKIPEPSAHFRFVCTAVRAMSKSAAK